MATRTPSHFDVAVFYLSVAGTAAALRLAEAGLSTCVLEHPTDLVMRDLAWVDPTPLLGKRTRGVDWEDFAKEQLRSRGVFLTDYLATPPRPAVHSTSGGPLQITFGDYREAEIQRVQCRSFIYAPVGFRHPVPLDWRTLELMTPDALRDSPYYGRDHAAIAGCGVWALMEAWWAAQRSKQVSVLCAYELATKAAHRAFPTLPNNVALLTNAQIRRVQSPEPNGRLLIEVSLSGVERLYEVDYMAWSPDPYVSWEPFAGQHELETLMNAGSVKLAGLAADVPFGDDLEMFASGIKVAEEIIRDLV